MSMKSLIGIALALALIATRGAWGAPAGYVKRTIPLDAPPVGLAFDADGHLFALENAGFGNHVATLRTILLDGSSGPSFPVVGDDVSNFFAGAMAYDHVSDRLLITDNTADGRIYAVDKNGGQQTIASAIAGVAGIAVRSSGEILVSTAPFGSPGEVLQVDRTTGAGAMVLGGLGFGAGLVFEPGGDLIVQDANATTFAGRLQRLPITESPGGLLFGAPQPLVDGMISSAGVVVDSEGDVFTTGAGGLYVVAGAPPAETSFDANGNPGQFATAVAFDPGSNPFKPFAGPDAGRLALMADFGFNMEDSFVTLLTPAVPEDFNSDGGVDNGDLAIWAAHFGAGPVALEEGDADSNGRVDGADFLQWQRRAGELLVLSGAAAGTAPIPEPAGWKLLCVAVAFCLAKRCAAIP